MLLLSVHVCARWNSIYCPGGGRVMSSHTTTRETMSYRQWAFMMDWCKIMGLPPAHEWAWDRAKAAWIQATTPAEAG